MSEKPERPRAWRMAGLAFLATMAAVSWSLAGHQQLGDLRGPSDLWLRMAIDSSAVGDLAIGGDVTMFKPPGYPAFLRLVLCLARHTPAPVARLLAVRSVGGETLQRLGGPIYWAQGLLLAGAAAALCLWLLRFLPASLALAAAICFGVNPYVLTYVGTPHYAILHMSLLVVSCWATERALAAPTRAWLPLVTAGLLWGLATLVRPVTLILPPFLLLAFAWRHRRTVRVALLRASFLVAIMLLAIAPWTARNYVLSGRLIPVNAQAWLAIWPATFHKSERDPNHYRWKEIRRPQRRMLRRVVGSPTMPYDVRNNLRVEDATRQSALRTVRRSPRIYLQNAWGSFCTYHIDVNSILIGIYAFIQRPGATLKSWYWPDQSREPYESPIADAFVGLLRGLSLLALGGLVWTLVRRDSPLLGTAAVHFSLVAAHSITWMDLMYYFVKWPFVVVLAYGFLHWSLGARVVRLRGSRWRLDVVAGWLVAAVAVTLAAALLS